MSRMGSNLESRLTNLERHVVKLYEELDRVDKVDTNTRLNIIEKATASFKDGGHGTSIEA